MPEWIDNGAYRLWSQVFEKFDKAMSFNNDPETENMKEIQQKIVDNAYDIFVSKRSNHGLRQGLNDKTNELIKSIKDLQVFCNLNRITPIQAYVMHLDQLVKRNVANSG